MDDAQQYLMQRYSYDQTWYHPSNPACNELFELKEDYCGRCVSKEKVGLVHWHGDQFDCRWGRDMGRWVAKGWYDEHDRPVERYPHP